jgi:hypothetical protein
MTRRLLASLSLCLCATGTTAAQPTVSFAARRDFGVEQETSGTPRGRAFAALRRAQERAKARGLDKLSAKKIDAEGGRLRWAGCARCPRGSPPRSETRSRLRP